MTDFEIEKYGEIQYLKGRLDELHKAYPTITNMERSRKLDGRISKYYKKLKDLDEVAYHLYMVEQQNRMHSKEKSKKELKELLEEILEFTDIKDSELINKIKSKISSF
ncbi:hypothetical protein MEN41_22430 [Dolichospermum sp. ST_con]|jgi:hypothetical protein|nr:hypothetical protein [Dolichospermum sp. ST_con]